MGRCVFLGRSWCRNNVQPCLLVVWVGMVFWPCLLGSVGECLFCGRYLAGRSMGRVVLVCPFDNRLIIEGL